MPRRIAVVVSQSQSANPAKRQLEEQLVAGLIAERGIDVTIVPHLYDLKPDGTGMLALQGIAGDLVVCSWLFPRAAHWTLDRNGIRGHAGVTLIRSPGVDEEDEDEPDEPQEEKLRVIDQRDMPARKIYCLDLRAHNSAGPYIDEIQRIAAEINTATVELTGGLANFSPANPEASRSGEPIGGVAAGPIKFADSAAAQPTVVADEAERRWYPVIDYSRCTNCLECIDFCLFGVYGIDRVDTILVEQPDNCRKGCPACSRVCPENAIIFPQHKTPTIAGSPEVAGGIKIDLSQLFGAPEPAAGEASAIELAARERDEQLLLAGREAVGLSIGIPKRQTDKPAAPKDQLDALIDQLDEFDL